MSCTTTQYRLHHLLIIIIHLHARSVIHDQLRPSVIVVKHDIATAVQLQLLLQRIQIRRHHRVVHRGDGRWRPVAFSFVVLLLLLREDGLEMLCVVFGRMVGVCEKYER